MDDRTPFLAEIARQLQRPMRSTPKPMPIPDVDYPAMRLSELNLEQRCAAFIEVATTVMLTQCVQTRAADAAEAARRLCEQYGGAPVLVSGDERLAAWGITARLQQEYGAVVWDPALGQENIRVAEQAKVGVVFAEYGLTESGGVVLFSAPERGRAISLLPTSSIFVLRKSTILPRVAQLAQRLRQRVQAGQALPACINVISGPSSTADIELIKVVGVHGPVNAAYLIIDDDAETTDNDRPFAP